MAETLDISTDDCIVERDGAGRDHDDEPPREAQRAEPRRCSSASPTRTSYIDDTPEVRAAILTGAGGTFSSGHGPRRGEPAAGSEYVERRMQEEPGLHWKALLRDYRCTKPMIAAVEGYAVAGGTEMLQGTDIRVAGEGAIFGVWEAKRGLFPLGGSVVPAPPPDPVHGGDGHPADAPDPCRRTRRCASGSSAVSSPTGWRSPWRAASRTQVAACGPLSTKAILRAWRETEHLSDLDAMRHQDPIGWEVFASEDAKEGPRAFAEKRPARLPGPVTAPEPAEPAPTPPTRGARAPRRPRPAGSSTSCCAPTPTTPRSTRRPTPSSGVAAIVLRRPTGSSWAVGRAARATASTCRAARWWARAPGRRALHVGVPRRPVRGPRRRRRGVRGPAGLRPRRLGGAHVRRGARRRQRRRRPSRDDGPAHRSGTGARRRSGPSCGSRRGRRRARAGASRRSGRCTPASAVRRSRGALRRPHARATGRVLRRTTTRARPGRPAALAPRRASRRDGRSARHAGGARAARR